MIPKKVLEGLQGIGGTFNENKTSELHRSEILKSKKENKKPELSNSEIIHLIRFPSYVARFFYSRFFNLNFLSYKKLAMT